MTSLPIRFGELDLYLIVEAASYAFVASTTHSWVLQDHILRNCEKYGMDFDFYRVLNGLSTAILDFDLSIFTNKDTFLPKAQYILANILFSKSVMDMNVKFDMTIR